MYACRKDLFESDVAHVETTKTAGERNVLAEGGHGQFLRVQRATAEMGSEHFITAGELQFLIFDARGECAAREPESAVDEKVVRVS